MINLLSSNELKLQKAQNYESVYEKPKSLFRALVQQLFLKILSKLFPKKFSSYKNKIRFIMNRSASHIYLFLISFCLRFRYPRYFILPSCHIYAIYIITEFFKILKPQKIDFFLLGGCLLGAVRQESFAGRPSDIDLGIKEDQLPKLLESIPLLIRSGAKFIRKRFFGKWGIINTGEGPTFSWVSGGGPQDNRLERLQILYPGMLIDIGIYRAKNVGGKEMWGNVSGDIMYKYKKNWIEKVEKDHVRNLNFFTISLDPLITVEAYGKFFLAPPNPEIYLEKKYGKNWRKPDKKQFYWNKNKLSLLRILLKK